MLNSLISEVRLLRSGIRTMYGDPGAAAGRIRHEHLSAVLRLTPMAMVANMGNASLILWSFKDSLTAGLFSWWAVMMTLASLSLLRATLNKPSKISAQTWMTQFFGLLCLSRGPFGQFAGR